MPPAERPHVILVVEDDPPTAAGLVLALKNRGYVVRLETRGDRARESAPRDPPDLAVVDLGIPGLCGFDLLRAWGARASFPVIVLTAAGDLDVRLRAFALGAADFVAKPFWVEELVARIRARLEPLTEEPRRRVSWQGVDIDLDARAIRADGCRPVDLTEHEFNVLAALALKRGKALSRRQIADAALADDPDRDDRAVDTHVARVRRKLGSAGSAIRTVWGIGSYFPHVTGAVTREFRRPLRGPGRPIAG